MTASESTAYDAYICHASEDKRRFVEELVAELSKLDIQCWYDSHEIQSPEDFRQRMDSGLSRARYGVVVLTESFFEKYWTQAELSALFSLEASDHQRQVIGKRIIPVRLDVTKARVVERLPLLSGRADISWGLGVATVAQHIRDIVRQERAPLPALRSRAYNLPVRRATQLFGREEDVERLLAMLSPGRAVRVAASVEGLAGIGKTELALHVVDRLSQTERFPDGIFWLDAENPDLSSTWGGAIADALAVDPGPVSERATAAIRIASQGPAVLVVLDNVERWTNDSIPRPLPSGSPTLLVTTRNSWLGGTDFEHYTLEVLRIEAARALLAAVSGRDLGREPGVEELLAYLDGHALALELAGAYLRRRPTVSPKKYLTDLQMGAPVEQRATRQVRYERTVCQALDAHERHLDAQARNALRVAACFAPNAASTRLLELCGVDPDLQEPLRDYHLITGDGESWQMHRLVREWARATGTEEEVELARRAFVEGCLEYARSLDLDTGFRIYQTDGPHLEKSVDLCAHVFGQHDIRLAELLEKVAIANASTGHLQRAELLLEQAIESNIENVGVDHPSVAISRTHLAMIWRDLGDPHRAKQQLEQVLASSINNLGVDHPIVANIRSNLATVLRDLGDPHRVTELLEQALESNTKALGADHPSVATRRSNLAMALRDLGELDRAKELLEQALESNIKNLGADHPSVAGRRSNLARVLLDLGELDRAKELLELALASLLTSLGENHPTTRLIRDNLASVNERLGI